MSISPSKPQNRICEVIHCYEAATEVVEVSAGKFGTINLILCHMCAVSKFQISTKRQKHGSLEAKRYSRKEIEGEDMLLHRFGDMT